MVKVYTEKDINPKVCEIVLWSVTADILICECVTHIYGTADLVKSTLYLDCMRWW